MRRSILSSLIVAALLSGCDLEDTETVYVKDQSAGAIEAELLTTSATTNTSYEDIGDSAYWINSDNNENSLLFVTLEGDGLAVYNPSGIEIEKLEGLEITGADIRYDRSGPRWLDT